MQDEATQIPQSLNRIMVFGLPGSGKSTFSTCLAKSLNVPIYHLDKYFFVENWKVREKSVFLKIQQDFVDQSQWVIDGNAMGSLEMRFQKADAAIYFRYPRFVCMWRLLRRRFQNWHLDDLAQGCTKNFGFRLIKYMFTFRTKFDAHINAVRGKYPHVHFFVFTSDRDVTHFLIHLTQ